jgi:hypothetical protein
METKTINKMERSRRILGFVGCFAMDPVGLSGGRALLWTKDREVSIQNFSRRHIRAIIEPVMAESDWTGFYGHPEPSKRHKLIIPNLVLAIERTVVRIAFAQVRVHIHKEP